MSVYKITISLPSRAAEQVRRAVKRGRAASASAYIASAIETKAKSETLDELFAEMLQQTGGPMTPAEIREADRALGYASRKRRKRPAPRKGR
jgi:Arc/MetJ-type ribon-helix-helix transcriptional regulator